jgi:hypothetical protein
VVLNASIIQAMRHHPDDGSSTHLRNVGLPRDYTALYPRRLSSSEVAYITVLNTGAVLSQANFQDTIQSYEQALKNMVWKRLV